MPKPFDAASKHLIEHRPGDWLKLAGFPVPDSADDISIFDADLSNVMTVIEQVRQRLASEMPVQEGSEFLLAMRVLMGLRYDEQIKELLMQSVSEMVDSVEWQRIARIGEVKGRLKGELRMLMTFASRRFGTPTAETIRHLQSINDADRLIALGEKVATVTSWDELLAP